MNESKTSDIYHTIRARILNFAALHSGDTVAVALGSRVYHVQAPDTVRFPYATIRVPDRTDSEGFRGDREEWFVEIQLYDKPRSKILALEDIADVIDEAFKSWTDRDNGLIFAQPGRTRTTLPAFDAPADREVCQVRMTFRFAVWPGYLTRYGIDS